VGAGGVIVTVCLNPAIDVTYRVLELSVGRSHRVLEVHARAGGKGVNVARVLHQLDEPVTVAGLCGGATGAEIAADLQRSGLPAAFTLISGQSRRTVTVVDARDATVFNEPGPPVSAAEWTAFTAAFDEIAKAGRVVVASGSVPPGCPDTAYAELVAIARANGAAVVLDAEGERLRHALGVRPDVAKPNAAEVAHLFGRPVSTRQDARDAAQLLCDSGAEAGIVSLGAEGFVAVTPSAVFDVRLPRRIRGNQTGAGDALAGAIARGLARHDPWPELLADAAALSAAAVAVPVAGSVAIDVMAEVRPGVVVQKV
jgi:1-phosphofructokinase family hexose kinase